MNVVTRKKLRSLAVTLYVPNENSQLCVSVGFLLKN